MDQEDQEDQEAERSGSRARCWTGAFDGTRVLAAAGRAIMAAGALLLAPAGAHTGYLTGLLPGYLLLGFGVGLVFPAASVAAMSRVSGDATGLASTARPTVSQRGSF